MKLTTPHASLISAILAVLLSWPFSALAADSAGLFQVVIGSVQLVGKDGKERAAVKGGSLYEGDRIVTADGALVQVKFTDGGLISVRANTEFVLDKFSYSGPQDVKPGISMSLLQGGLRSITGMIGKTNRDGYLITTKSATIGIRGTDHEPRVILPPPPGVKAIDLPGTYDKVNEGRTFLRTPQGIVEILPRQVGFAPSADVAPKLLPKIPDFYRTEPQKQGVAAPVNKPNEQSEQTADKPADGKPAAQKQEATAPANKPNERNEQTADKSADSKAEPQSRSPIHSTAPQVRELTPDTKARSSDAPVMSTGKVPVPPTAAPILSPSPTISSPPPPTISSPPPTMSSPPPPTISSPLPPTVSSPPPPTMSSPPPPTTISSPPPLVRELTPDTRGRSSDEPTPRTKSPSPPTIFPRVSPTTTKIDK